jgi:hypothetical protein
LNVIRASGSAEPKPVILDSTQLRLETIFTHAVIERENLHQQVKKLLEVEVCNSGALGDCTKCLVRVLLITFANPSTECLLIVTMHRLVADEWSLYQFANDLLADRSATPTPDKLQYLDYAHWQRMLVQQSQAASSEDVFDWLPYWRNKFSVPPPVLQLPIDRPRPPHADWACHRRRFKLDAEFSSSVKDLLLEISTKFEGIGFSQEEVHKRTSTLLLAVYALLLNRYTGEEDVMIAIQLAGRPRQAARELLGPIANTLYLRTNLHRYLSLRELYANVDVELSEILMRQVLYPMSNGSLTRFVVGNAGGIIA